MKESDTRKTLYAQKKIEITEGQTKPKPVYSFKRTNTSFNCALCNEIKPISSKRQMYKDDERIEVCIGCLKESKNGS